MRKLIYILILNCSLIAIISCDKGSSENDVVCPKVIYKELKYCAIPYVEMQANYNNLDGVMVAVSGIFSVQNDVFLLVDPSTYDYDVPKPYNVVEVRLSGGIANISKDNREKHLHGKYVTVFGRFKAKNVDDEKWQKLIAHRIDDSHVVQSSP